MQQPHFIIIHANHNFGAIGKIIDYIENEFPDHSVYVTSSFSNGEIAINSIFSDHALGQDYRNASHIEQVCFDYVKEHHKEDVLISPDKFDIYKDELNAHDFTKFGVTNLLKTSEGSLKCIVLIDTVIN